MKAPRDTHARGWLLPSALFAILAALASARLFHRAVISNSQLQQDTLLGQRVHERLQERLASHSPLLGACEIQTGTFLGIARRYKVCGDRALPFTTVPTFRLPGDALDFDLLTRTLQTCSSIIPWSHNNGHVSPATSTSCVSPTQYTGSLFVGKNLVGTSLQLISQSSNVQSVVSAGFISLNETLETTHDLLIVAGGNISLERIRNASNEAIRVSLFSSLGDISVHHVEGAISLLAAGRKKISVPPTAQSSQYPLPPFRPRTIRGFEVLD